MSLFEARSGLFIAIHRSVATECLVVRWDAHEGTGVGPLDVQKFRPRAPRADAAMRVLHEAGCGCASRYKQILPSRLPQRPPSDVPDGSWCASVDAAIGRGIACACTARFNAPRRAEGFAMSTTSSTFVASDGDGMNG